MELFELYCVDKLTAFTPAGFDSRLHLRFCSSGTSQRVSPPDFNSEVTVLRHNPQICSLGLETRVTHRLPEAGSWKQ